MTDRRGDQGFTVAPQRLGNDRASGRSRGRRIALVLVIVAATAILTIAWLGPRLSARPNFDTAFFATPTPSKTPQPSPSAVPFGGGPNFATPLPAITRPDGPRPSGRIAIVTDVLHVVDLATGAVLPGPPIQYGRDAVFPAPSGGWTCVCFADGVDPARPSLIARIAAIDPSGAVTDPPTRTEYPVQPQAEGGQATLSTDVDMIDGGQRGVLALAVRGARTWRFSLAAIDVDGRRIAPSVLLGEARPPSPAPSAGPSTQPTPAASATDGPPPDQFSDYVDGPQIRISADGRMAFVWAALRRDTPDGPSLSSTHAWRVALGPDGSIGEVTDAPGLLQMPPYCSGIGFAAADRLAWLCPVYSDDPSIPPDGRWSLGTVDLDGRPAGETELTIPPDDYFDVPLFDRANGQIYAWDAASLTIFRIDAHALSIERSRFDPVAASSAGLAPGGGTDPVDWHHPASAVRQFSGTISGAPDGSHLYAVGFDPTPTSDGGAQPSRGVFVIDRLTLALVDRWAPAAEYVGITVLPGGLVAAAGAPGLQADGHSAPWEASLTIHDPTDGHVVIRFGQLGSDMLPLVLGR